MGLKEEMAFKRLSSGKPSIACPACGAVAEVREKGPAWSKQFLFRHKDTCAWLAAKAAREEPFVKHDGAAP